MWRRQSHSHLSHGPSQASLTSVRRLMLALVISVLGNVLLLGGLIYQNIRLPLHQGNLLPHSSWDSGAVALAEDRTNEEVLSSLVYMLPEQLVARLKDAKLIENGYSQRDLALGCLVTLHHFDIAKALTGEVLPTERHLDVSFHQAPITVFPGLSDRQYATVLHFIQTERWPLTSEGLFLALQHASLKEDQSLADAFFLTPEYLAIQRLFVQCQPSPGKHEILHVLTEGSWEKLNHYADPTCPHGATECMRRRLLVDYHQEGSKAAIQLLVKTDHAFAARKLDDATVLQVLSFPPSEALEAFARTLADSPRSDKVLAAARSLIPDQPPLVSEKGSMDSEPILKPVISDRVYVVQEGDSLWKIARKTQVDIHTLKTHNHLKGDLLHPGTTLHLP